MPLIIVTGVTNGPEHDEMRAVGCAAILLKPVEQGTLVAEIRRVLEVSAASIQATGPQTVNT